MATSKASSHKSGAKKEGGNKGSSSKKSAASKKAGKLALKSSSSKKEGKPASSDAVPKGRKNLGTKPVFGSGFEASGETIGKLERRRVEKDLYASERVIPRPANIPESQWELPAGFRPDGSFATLAEVVSDPVPTLSLESLSSLDKTKLIIERIKLQEDYPTRYMLGVGEVSRERAIVEIEAGSPAGKAIQETEQKKIQLLQRAARQI